MPFKAYKKIYYFIVLLFVICYLLFVKSVFAQISTFFGPVAGICEYWKKVFDFSVGMAGILTVLALMLGGLYYVVSMGDKEKIGKAKEIMGGALAGFLLILLGWTLFNAIAPQLNQCKIEVAYLELKGKSIKEMEMQIEGVYTPEGGVSEMGDPCAGIPDEKLFTTKEDCEGKGGEEGGKCEGVCAESQPSSEKKTEEKEKSSPGPQEEKTQERKGKWCCKSRKGCLANPVYYSQLASSGAPWGKKYFGSCPGGPEKNAIGYVGCGPTTIAMVLSTFGIKKNPGEVADEVVAAGYRVCGGGMGQGAISAILSKYGLNVYTTNFEGAKKALLTGEAVIASGGPDKKTGASHTFTDHSHFIFIHCYNESTKTFSVYSSSSNGKKSTGDFSEAIIQQDMLNYWAVSQPPH